jgi:putative endonuclease
MDKDGSKLRDWKIAEDLAVQYLKWKGYKILQRNYRTPFGEIDIIAKTEKTYVFVEVKSGSGKRISPSERVDNKKYKKILESAQYFLKKESLNDYAKVRIDVIEVIYGTIKHYENIGWDFV